MWLNTFVAAGVLVSLLGWEDWEFWYWGLLPIGLCVIATFLVHHFYWKNTQDISAPIDDLVKPMPDDVVKPVDEPADDVAKPLHVLQRSERSDAHLASKLTTPSLTCIHRRCHHVRQNVYMGVSRW